MKVKFNLKRKLSSYSINGAIRAAFEQNKGYIIPRLLEDGVPENRLFARFRYDVMDQVQSGVSIKRALNNVHDMLKTAEEKASISLLNRIREGSGMVNGKKGEHYDLFKALRKAAGWNEKIDPKYLKFIETEEHKELRLQRKAEKLAGTYDKNKWKEFEKGDNVAHFIYEGPKGSFEFTIERRAEGYGSLVKFEDFIGGTKL